jgi:DNA-binding transcriptional MerR regulator
VAELLDLLTKADVAKIIGITPAGVAAMHQRGELKASRTAGGVRLFRRMDVEEVARRRAELRRPRGVERRATDE